ncbi:hypothetical protein B0T20DRAFT_433108 [Sordaria brevicollis]|uniref:Uncharacterized protein n=1 Tax=Sordaria brevicollis TaxID=83679 RepID=A0AAE0UEA1_SORBR|nr:hypothetical protein B0T20DRAFT_433108 [Sordaria brevicollis]
MDNPTWLPLKQTHYPPPSLPSMKTGHPTGPLSLGHIIPDLQHLDNVINCHGFEPFPTGMDIMTATFQQSHFKTGCSNTDISIHVKAEALPQLVKAIPGVEAGMAAGTSYVNIVDDKWEYEALEEYAVYPSQEYVERALREQEVAEYIRRSKKMGGWKVYMVTGIVVARGGGRQVCSEERGWGVEGSVKFNVPGITEFSPEVGWDKRTKSTVNGHHTADFVCAIRLVKISKSGLRSNWTMKTVTRKL